MRWGDDCTFAEDGRRAEPKLQPYPIGGGEQYWSLGVKLYAGRGWPVDSYVRLELWEKRDGTIVTDSGRYWPQSAQGDGDDGA